MSAAFVFFKETLTVSIQGELDHHTAREIRKHIDSEISRRCPKFLELDFSQVTFMDSSGIGLVMGRYKIMSERQGKVIILNPTPPIKKVMMISGVNKLAKIVNAPKKQPQETKTVKAEVKKVEACKQEYSK